MSQRGSLCVVGLGPGTSGLLTGQAQAALHGADVVIGYEGYFSWVADLVQEKECVALPLTQEVARAELAVARALAGQAVSVISSGDAGVYGMASLVLEVLERQPNQAALPDVVVIPGVSAVNACAALLGAPIAHDFAVLSLSDLLTPWAVIEKRLAAAAEADFVLVLLNPRSARRQAQFMRACELIAQYRAAATPVGLVRNAYRPDQSVTITTVGTLPVAQVDMLTTVIIGNSQTRCFQSRLITPRGYL
ncbi:MAG: precorrin-3B C(17)-methyltransferase [Candidatus Tectomicrobia bacterium]|uniref:Precorrin-3B C(17)-methyltransferase n=1 Tax=Tectimicrobiota bacterium TaxID=2528274 RepID=A0A937W3J3_UNCTE|nr:precorrin-3B C(17)-methyltransferase [Candidatus Tectomicrobia bacterium]